MANPNLKENKIKRFVASMFRGLVKACNKELYVKMSSVNETSEKGTLICATYKNNMLLSVEMKVVEIGAISAITPCINTENADMVKAFYWKEANNIPYCEAVTIFR